VDKRIDVLATALYAGLGVEDLEGLDLAYAPPYSSAKDPVILAGYVAANAYRGEVRLVTAAEVARRLDQGERVRLLDVRSRGEYAAGHIPGAQHIPLDSLRERLSEVERDGRLTVYCGVGYRSYHAGKILAHASHEVENLSGGFTSWVQAFPERVERPG
jgi:rhodanese-related sulfurtransferase